MGVVGLEPELLAVRLRRVLVRDIEMAPKGPAPLAADQADEVILLDRTTHRHRRRRFSRGWPGVLPTERRDRAANRLNQVAEISHGQRVWVT